MIKNISIIILCLACIFVSSCSTSTKITIQGTAGTDIYKIDGTNIGTIPYSGILKLKIEDETYNAFLLSQKPGESLKVPFALNYKNKSHLGANIAEVAGYTITAAGCVCVLAGGIAALAGDAESVGGPLLAGGAGAAALGAAIGAPATFRKSQDSYVYNYQYLPYQYLNDDIKFTSPNLEYDSSPKSENNNKIKIRPSISEKAPSSKPINKETQVAKRDLGSNTTKIQGSYVGLGKITLDNETIETLKGITIQIKRIDSSSVYVDIIEADGTYFFGSSTKYIAAKDKNGGMTLKHSSISDAIITIDKNGVLKYNNPALEVDGTVYTLSITGEKQQPD